MTNSVKITKDEFDASYPLLKNHLNADSGWAFGDDGGCLFETYGEALDFVRQQPPSTVWTLVDGDDGDQYLLSGFHVVNRIGYLLSTVPVPVGADIQVRIPAQAGPAPRSTEREARKTLYNVHVYREMRLYFPGIEAQTPHEAARIAANKPTDEAALTEDCDGVTLAALVDVAGDDGFEQSKTIEFDHGWLELLARRQQIALIWSVEDVQEARPDLSNAQAMELLEYVRDKHDAMLGVSWTTLECAAEELFGDAPETDEAGERP